MSTHQRTSLPPAAPSRRRDRAIVALAVAALAASVVFLVEANGDRSSVCASVSATYSTGQSADDPIASGEALARQGRSCS